MEETGVKEELGVGAGKLGGVDTPMYEPKMCELNMSESAELKTQRDQNLSELDEIAI